MSYLWNQCVSQWRDRSAYLSLLNVVDNLSYRKLNHT